MSTYHQNHEREERYQQDPQATSTDDQRHEGGHGDQQSIALAGGGHGSGDPQPATQSGYPRGEMSTGLLDRLDLITAESLSQAREEATRRQISIAEQQVTENELIYWRNLLIQQEAQRQQLERITGIDIQFPTPCSPEFFVEQQIRLSRSYERHQQLRQIQQELQEVQRRLNEIQRWYDSRDTSS